MASANTDKFNKVGSPNTATTLGGAGHSTSGTSITVGSTTGWPSDTGVVFAIDRVELVDGVETQISGTYTEWIGTVASGTSIDNMTLSSLSPNADQNYSAGSTTRVYIPVAATQVENLVDGLVAEHNQDGTHSDITAPTVTTTADVTVGGDINVADTKSIKDGNDNELVKFSETASAVNEVTVKNAATGNNPQLQATGGDTNIGLKGVAKGSGVNSGWVAAKIGTIAPSANGQVAVTGLGFAPKLLEMHVAPSASSSTVRECRGFYDGTTQFSLGHLTTEGGDNSTGVSTSWICFLPQANSATDDRIAMDSLDADGFTYTKSDHQSTTTFYYIAYG